MSQLTVQVPDSVLRRAKVLAEREDLSIEEYILRLLQQAAGEEAYWEQRVRRGRSVTRDRFLAILSKAPDEPEDKIDGDPQP